MAIAGSTHDPAMRPGSSRDFPEQQMGVASDNSQSNTNTNTITITNSVFAMLQPTTDEDQAGRCLLGQGAIKHCLVFCLEPPQMIIAISVPVSVCVQTSGGFLNRHRSDQESKSSAPCNRNQ